jgi:hypothetical protein
MVFFLCAREGKESHKPAAQVILAWSFGDVLQVRMHGAADQPLYGGANSAIMRHIFRNGRATLNLMGRPTGVISGFTSDFCLLN